MAVATSIIKDEHRSMAAVINGLEYLIGEIKENRTSPDFTLLGAMLDYIEAFPERLHHPKEDEYLFKFLRQRSPEAHPILDELEAQHIRGAGLLGDLRRKLEDYRHSGQPAFSPFEEAIHAYAAFHWEHMRKEEDVVFPLAERHLTAEDWQAIDAAFHANHDPIIGVETTREFRELFRRIVSLAPPPIGVGPGTPT